MKAVDSYKKLWRELRGVKLFLFYTLHYTIVFLILHHFFFEAFHTAGKSYMWTEDGGAQHLPKMLYVADVVKEAFKSLFSPEGIWFPAYDFRLGTRAPEIYLEPLQIFSVLVPMDKMDILYDILIAIRFYMVGLSFSVLGFYFKQKPISVMVGAISYTFCGFAVYAGVRHPSYLAPMIFMALLIVGVDMVIQGRKGYLLTLVVFLILMTGVYFAFMMALMCVLYTVIRFFDVYKEDLWANFWKMLGRLCIYIIPAVLISCAVILPTISQLLGTGRMGRDTSLNGSMWRYSLGYRRKFFGNFTIYPSASSWTCLGFSILALPAIILMYKKKCKELITLKILFPILTTMLLVPGAAYVMSVFNSYVNRWCFMYALCVAAIIMFMLPKLCECSWKEMSIVIIVSAIYYALTISYYGNSVHIVFLNKVLIGVIAALLLIYLLSLKSKTGAMALGLVITCISTYATADIMYSPDEQNYIKEFTDKGGAYNHYQNSQYGAFAESCIKNKDDSFYRVGVSNIEPVAANISYLYDINGITHFSASAYNWYNTWQYELESASKCANNKNYGVDARSAMLALSAVKYYVTDGENNDVVPYGYVLKETIWQNGKKRNIYENTMRLPLGYTYSSFIKRADYDKLSSLEKQEAMMQSVVLEENPDGEIREKKPFINTKEIPFKVKKIDNASISDGVITVGEKGATVTIAFEGLPYSETYLYVKNFDITRGSASSNFVITAATEKSCSKARFYSDVSIYSNGKKSQMLNLGYSEEGFKECVITFPVKGKFSLEGFGVYCQSMDNYDEYINERLSDAPDDFTLTNKGVSCTMNSYEDRILCMSIPYDKGWDAYVDGERVKVRQANTGFLAIEVPKGEHRIEFEYSLPGLKTGISLSFAGIIILFALVLKDVKKVRKKETKNV